MSSDRKSRRDRRLGIFRSTLALTALGLLGAVLSACPGSLENPEDFTGVKADIIGPKCATGPCHSAMIKAGGLDLTPDADLEKRIINAPATGPGCSGKIVDPAAPEMSLLYTKCLMNAPCGTQMPQVGAALTQEELDELLMWITGLK